MGFISSVTCPFCAACTRARLTADGRLRLCLLREDEVDLLTPLRAGATLEELRQIILDGIWYKPWGHGLAEGDYPAQPGDERDRGIISASIKGDGGGGESKTAPIFTPHK